MFRKRRDLRSDDRPNLTCTTTIPLMGWGLLITLVDASIEPALLVAGVAWSLSIRGRTRMDDHGLFSQTPGTPLCPFMDGTMIERVSCDVHHEDVG